jgi:filamentous hemagglutinin family protein
VALLGSVLVAPASLAQIALDGTPGQLNVDLELAPDEFTIDGANGIASEDGSLILHSFEEFNLDADQTATFFHSNAALEAAAQNVLARVTGVNESRLLGTMVSEYPNADLIFVNPNGVFFGEGFQADVQQGFHTSTADVLEFRNLESGALTNLSTGSSALVPDLSMAEPSAWGFLDSGPEGGLTMEGFGVSPQIVQAGHAINHITRDDTSGQIAGNIDPIDVNGELVYEILGEHGLRADDGSLLLHSFSDFTLDQNETALYKEGPGGLGDSGIIVDTILTRVTGTSQSVLNGTIRSKYENADLVFMNRNGLVFGGDFKIDLAQSFIGSTADGIELLDDAGGLTIVDMSSTEALMASTGSNIAAARFLPAGPSLGEIEIGGFRSISEGDPFEKNFVFIGRDVVFGSSPVETDGHGLIAVAFGGGSGRIENNLDLDLDQQPIGTTLFGLRATGLDGTTIDPTGSVEFSLSTEIDTTIEGADGGGAVFWGGSVDASGGNINTRGAAGNDGGIVFLDGRMNMDVNGLTIDAGASGGGNSGVVFLDSPNLLGFDPDNIDISADAPGFAGDIIFNGQSVFAGIFRDNTAGQSNTGALIREGDFYIILGDDGVRSDDDSFLLHSFLSFNLALNETALYQEGSAVDPAVVRTILTRVTGNRGSEINGTIESRYDNAEMVFVNSNGILFGQSFTLDLAQSFVATTADEIEFLNADDSIVVIDANSTALPGESLVAPDFHAVRFTQTLPASIGVEGLKVVPRDLGVDDVNSAVAFVAGNVGLGVEGVDSTLQTNGFDLFVVAIGRNGRIEVTDSDPSVTAGAADVGLIAADLSGAPINPSGEIRFFSSTKIESHDVPSGYLSSSGDVILWGGKIDVRKVSIDTNAVFRNAGHVIIRGNNVDLSSSSIAASSSTGSGGNIHIEGLNSVNFVTPNSDKRAFIDTSASNGLEEANFLNIVAGNSINAQGLQIAVSNNSAEGNSTEIRVAANSLQFQNGRIDARGDGVESAANVTIEGDNVNLSGSFINVSSEGRVDPELGPLSGTAGSVSITGNDQLNLTDTTIDASATAASTSTEVDGDGGDITLSSAEFIGLNEPAYLVVGNGDAGVAGTLSIVELGNDVTEEAESAIDSTDNLFAGDSPSEPDAGGGVDPVGFGDLQPFIPPTPGVALAGPERKSASGTSAKAVGEALDEAEEEIAAASSSAQAKSSSKKKGAKVPGVAFFTSTSEAAPIVPRTCESIAGRDSKSKFLAVTSKRLPTSPEDWLISFDTTGDQLLAAAENADLPAVGAIGTDGASIEDVQRNARTQRALASAAVAVRGGRFEEAAVGFETVVNELEAAMDARGASEALLAYAHLQQNDGRYTGARQSLERALALAEPVGDEELTASIRTSLGNALIGTGELVRAEEELTRGLNIVIASGDSGPAPAVLNNLGNRHAATRDFKSALWAYERSAKLARELGRTGDQARALAGAARAAADSGQLRDARRLLDMASPLIAGLEGREQVSLHIHMGRSFAQLAVTSPAGRSDSLLSAFGSYDAALKGAEELGDLRSVALANLNLGALYREEQHHTEALYLTRLARRAAEGIDALELLYRAHWQEGGILWSQREIGPALAAHRRAVAILEETKPVASDGYGTTAASFRIAVGGVYQDTVDLLLQTAGLVKSEHTASLLITEARDTLEKLKGAELRDYFEDECIASVGGEGREIDNLGENAAVVYMITLPDRIEMLVGLPGGIERFTTNVSAAKLASTVDQFRLAVQNPLTNNHRALGKKLYNWIVAPYIERMDEEGIETLVFIPDGRLRTLPFAALSDADDDYVGDRFAMVTALSLRLLTAPELSTESGRPVLAGVSESVQGFAELAAVPDELAQIQEIRGGEVLLNEGFTLSNVRKAVSQEVPSIVHLATHAVFTGNPDTSFLLTYGGRVGFDDLADVVGMTRADGAPLDLLVLSACETAVGNDRAGLGFTGSAIRAGARSALGSLWPISDQAARSLMINFYQGLQSKDLNKAEALQKAQTVLRENERFSHPFYWAPFTLVNDWM